ncbi:Hypothetical predicted protein [Olea europaea subsp. europaea]|uniref:Uncharacterized protein n=1 Tax=Olea europaea subsp. europaea TaxID=158383 RepID=A0A8S0QXA0_OLEEU|nr:Hypothetical predicted protein [Olea europaea subsp. europaea]
MAQEYNYISLRDILKKEKFPNLSFFEYSPSESEVELDYPSAKAMAMPTPSPFAIANSSDESSGQNSSMGHEEETKRISDKHLFSKNCNNSGTVYKGKLLASAPISSLKSSKSGEPLIYQRSEGNDCALVLDGVEIHFNFSLRPRDERRFKLALLYDDSEDEEEKQMTKEEEEKEKPYVDADKEGKGREDMED